MDNLLTRCFDIYDDKTRWAMGRQMGERGAFFTKDEGGSGETVVSSWRL